MQKPKHSATFLLICGAVACGAEDPASGDSHGTGGGDGARAGTAAGVSGKGGSSGAGTSQGGSAGAGAGNGGAAMGGALTAGNSAGGGVAGSSAFAGGAGTTGGVGGAMSSGGVGSGAAGLGGDSSAGASNNGGMAGQGGRGAGGMSAGMGGKAGTSGSAGKAGSGGTSSGSCDAPPAPSPLVGWASVSGGGVTTTTGGGNATPVTVTTLSEFQSAVGGSTAAVVYVKGKLAAGKTIIGSNKTIAGICGAELHGHLELSGSSNVIVRNIAIVGYGAGNCALDPDYDSATGCSSGNDAISVQKNAHHVWFDHCDISDGTDGNLDITNGANYVTVSWTKFHYSARTDDQGDDSTGDAGHRYSNLVGGTDSPSDYDDANALNVTWHHDWWADRVVERQPRVRFGKNHLFNNLWNASGNNYCVRAGKQARILVEQGVFSGIKDAHEFNSDTDKGTANIIAGSDNTYTGTSGVKETGGGGPAIGTLPYSYTADAASSVSAAVQSGAGPK
jgi:pectate lyase